MRWVVVVLVLGACEARSPYFRDAPVTRVTVEQAVFDVRRRGRLAEAIRINPQYAPHLKSVAPHAETAMRTATGCDVRELRGDAAQILGLLDCSGADAAPLLVPARRTADCEVVDVFVPAGGTTGYLEAECD